MKALVRDLKTSIIAVFCLAVLLCLIYPLVVWGMAQLFFPHQANGSLIIRDGKIVGSELLAQNFTDSRYFHPRPSFAGDQGYDAANSGGGNQGPISRKLIETIEQRVADYRSQNNLSPDVKIPADAVTASASGLDPDIGIQNAQLQARRVARARGIPEQKLLEMIETLSEPRYLGILGNPRVNIIKLNLALDAG